MTSTRSPATSTRSWSALDLRDATVVGFSLGTGELARYIGTHGTERLRACVFIESLAPSFAKSAENPEGVDAAGVAGVQQAILDDRYAWLTGLLGDLPQPRRVPRHAGQRGDGARELERGAGGVAGRDVGVPARVAGGLQRGHQADRRPDADPSRHRRPDPADRRARAGGCTPRCPMRATSRSRAARTSCASPTPTRSTASCSRSSASSPPSPRERHGRPVVHDFMLLNAMSEANATRAAIAQATAFLRTALSTS